MKRVLFFAIYCLTAAGISFGQAPMPQAAIVSASLPQNTNIWKADAYTATNQPGATSVECAAGSGVVYAIAADTTGTNYLLGSGSEQTVQAANGLTEIIENDDIKLIWYPSTSILYAPDLGDWQTLTIYSPTMVLFPPTNQMFFRLP